MKSIFLIPLWFCFAEIANAQNLVPNPSFEDTVYCPCCTNQIDAATNWMNYGKTPDYWNACTPIYGVPYNGSLAFQYAHTGNAMAGVATYRNPNSPDGPNYREFIGVQLLNPLQTDQKYYFSFYTNFSFYHPFQAVSSNKIGLRFFKESYTSSNSAPIDNFAHLFADSILTDSVSWYRLIGSFTADSPYMYVSIGNFFDDMHTDTLVLSQYPDGAYFFVDDICVTTDSIYNESWTGLHPHVESHNLITIYPNPSWAVLNIKSAEKIETIQILNEIGLLVFEAMKISDFSVKVVVEHLPQGLYFIRVKTKNSFSSISINIIH